MTIKPQRIVVPPCPDLAVSKRWNGKLEITATRAEGNSFRYRLRIAVQNEGIAPMPEGAKVEVRSGKKGGKLRKEIHHIKALKPGEQPLKESQLAQGSIERGMGIPRRETFAFTSTAPKPRSVLNNNATRPAIEAMRAIETSLGPSHLPIQCRPS